MEMNLNLAPNKHMLDLNFDEDSSQEDSHNSQNTFQKPKFQKVYDLDVDVLKRDKFTSNKVQKGLFTSESETFQYDNFQVQQKPQIYKPANNPSQKHNPTQKSEPKKQEQGSSTIKIQPKAAPNILSLQFQEKSSSEDDNSIQESELEQRIAQKKLQSEAMLQSKKKLLQLDFSESSSEDQQKSQKSKDQPEHKNPKKADAKKGLIKKKQERQKEKDKKEQQQRSSEQEQDKSKSQQKKQKQQSKQEQKPVILKDFEFTKQPQYQVLDQIRPQQRVRAIISRCRSGLNLFFPEYQIKIQSTKQQILYVKKQVIFFKGQYKIYSRTSTGHMRYFGKLQANMSGTEYQIFISQNGVHETLKAEMYFPNDAKGNQPRYFIMISLIDGYNISDLVVDDPNYVTLKELYKNQKNKNKMMILHTRKPVFHEQIRGFVLNFSGRVSMPSIKNFILEDVITQNEVLMFGKIDKDNFRIQISSPLNCVLGTAVALIQFEGRFME